MAKYKVKHTSIMHNKTVYGEGSEVELTEIQATRLADFVELISEQMPEKPKTQSAKVINKKTETKANNSKPETKSETKTEEDSTTDVKVSVGGSQ